MTVDTQSLSLRTSRRSLLLGAGALAVGGCVSRASVSGLTSGGEGEIARSPSGQLELRLSLPATGTAVPQWTVRRSRQDALLPSNLGLYLADGRVLGEGATLISHRRERVDKSWKPPFGISSDYPDCYEELTLGLRDPTGIEFAIIARVYDSGVALRYRILKLPSGGELTLTGEATHFRFASGSMAYASRDEGEYQHVSPRSLGPVPHPELTSNCDPEALADLPVTVETTDLAMAICESDRLHYPRLMLRAVGDGSDTLVTHLMRFPGRATGPSGPGDTPSAPLFNLSVNAQTPWRVLLVAASPGALIEASKLVATLASPNRLGDISWLRPGRCYRVRRYTTELGLKGVDFAVRRKLDYIEFDWHWYGDGTDDSDATVPIPGFDIRRIVDYGKQKGVGVIVYIDRAPAMKQLDDIVRTYQAWGIAGIKFGFIWEGRQADVDWIYEVVRKCGEHKLFVSLHDNLRPAGLERTLPNYLALEGVRGNEQFPTPRHNVTLPFTRNLGGPMDYTICYAERRNRTTNAHQMAMAAVYYNPLNFLYWYDDIEKYHGDGWPELSWFDECPVTWDETRTLSGRIGEYVTVARRSGKRWFLGAMTNEEGRQLRLPLRFLGQGRWNAHIYADGESGQPLSNTSVVMRTLNVDASDILDLALAPAGGQAIRFEPA